MNTLTNISVEKDALQKAVVLRTQEMALKALEEEYEAAKVNIMNSSDLRVLKSMVKRIATLNHPRGSSGRP